MPRRCRCGPRSRRARSPNGLTYYILQARQAGEARVPVARGQRGLGAGGRRSARARALRRAHGVQRHEAVPEGRDRQLPREHRHAVRRRSQRVHDVGQTVYSSRCRPTTRTFIAQGPRHPARLGRRRHVRPEGGRQGARRRASRSGGSAAAPACACSTSTRKVLFKGSRYADRITIGLPEILDKAPRDTLYRFYKDWYRPDLMAVIAVGDFDPRGDGEGDQGAVRRSQEPDEASARARAAACRRPRARASRSRPIARRPATRDLDREPRPAPARVVEQATTAGSSPSSSTRQILNERLASIARRPMRRSSRAFGGIDSRSCATSTRSRAVRAGQERQGRGRAARAAHRGRARREARHHRRASSSARARIMTRSMRVEPADTEATRDSREFTERDHAQLLRGRAHDRPQAREGRSTLKILPTLTRRGAQRARQVVRRRGQPRRS